MVRNEHNTHRIDRAAARHDALHQAMAQLLESVFQATLGLGSWKVATPAHKPDGRMLGCVAGTDIDKDGLKLLADALKQNKTLLSLNLTCF